MNKEKALVQKGKRLSYLLRHDQSYTFDAHGYREVSDLIQNHGYTMEELLEIVATNNKKRYEFNDDKTKIRARQGHSVNVNVDLRECVPPEILYHGTATRFLDSILKNGINKGTRLHVHLSPDEETAVRVGERHGSPVVLRINAWQMHDDGHKFYLSNNGVWLTDFVAPNYLIIP
jgi:putative RNA 2'-phosphotransferase